MLGEAQKKSKTVYLLLSIPTLELPTFSDGVVPGSPYNEAPSGNTQVRSHYARLDSLTYRLNLAETSLTRAAQMPEASEADQVGAKRGEKRTNEDTRTTQKAKRLIDTRAAEPQHITGKRDLGCDSNASSEVDPPRKRKSATKPDREKAPTGSPSKTIITQSPGSRQASTERHETECARLNDIMLSYDIGTEPLNEGQQQQVASKQTTSDASGNIATQAGGGEELTDGPIKTTGTKATDNRQASTKRLEAECEHINDIMLNLSFSAEPLPAGESQQVVPEQDANDDSNDTSSSTEEDNAIDDFNVCAKAASASEQPVELDDAWNRCRELRKRMRP